MKQAEIGAALAGVAATQKFDANQFWAGVLKRRAPRQSDQRNQSRSLQDGLGVASTVLSWNQLQSLRCASNKRIYRNGTGQVSASSPAQFGQYDRAFVQFLAQLPANGLVICITLRLVHGAGQIRRCGVNVTSRAAEADRNAAIATAVKTYKGL